MKKIIALSSLISSLFIRVRNVFAVFLNLFLLLFIPPRLTAQKTYVHTVTATQTYEGRIYLTKLHRIRIETRNVSLGGDPVLHLLSPSRAEVMVNDNNGGSLAAAFNYLPIVTGWYTVIVRAKDIAHRGTADLYKDGTLMAEQIAFAGTALSLKDMLAKESIEIVKLPQGTTGKDRLYILKANGIGIQRDGSDWGPFHMAKIKLNSNLGDCIVIIGTEQREGLVRVVRNDAEIPNHDPDNDGLGNEVEKAVGTCSTRSGSIDGCDCSTIADARDTDGDGIPDGWEVLGRTDVWPLQLLPKWGADPRHKDMFIEVDFMRRTLQDNDRDTVLNMTAAAARNFAAIYGDAFTTDPVTRAQHAATMKNPDRLPGISLHLDTGRDPETDADATIFGNWGGFNAVDAISGNGVCDNDHPNCKGVPANTAWKDVHNFSIARRGIFRYALGYPTGGGSNNTGFACDFNFYDLYIPAHEWGHTMDLGHSGRNHVTGDIDVNCKPNYPSIMNYAVLNRPGVGFADGEELPPLNNASLTEWHAVSPTNTGYLDRLENVFGYWVDRRNGNVDWNRNGTFEPAGQTVQAYANYQPGNGNGCEFTRYNQLEFFNAQTTTTPVMARLNKRLYVFYTKDGAVKYKSSDSNWDCTELTREGCNNGTWSNEKDAGFQQSVGVDIMNDLSSLRIVSVQSNGKIMEKRLTLIGGLEQLSATQPIAGSADGEPSLSFGLTGSYLLYKGTDKLIHFNRFFAGQWQGDQVAYQSENQPVRSTDAWAFPCIIQTFLPWKPNSRELYALIPDENSLLNMWYYNRSTNFWEKTNVMEDNPPGPIHNKPSMVYVPYQTQQENPGRLYIVYVSKSQPGSIFNGRTRMRMSYVKVSTNGDGSLTKTEKIGLDSYYDNVSFCTYGISLFYEHGKDKNLRAICTVGNAESGFLLRFRPKSDGINDFEYKNYNDWETIRLNACKLVVNPGGTVTNPVRCLDH
jgi:Bacterial TSP3 repeat